MKEYNKSYVDFCKKHGDHREDTTLENGITRKMVIFEDSAVWYEVYGEHYETVNVEVKGLVIPTTIKLFKCEYWSTDDSKSRYAYSRY